MDDHYYVSRYVLETYKYEVHRGTYHYLSATENRIYLGYFSDGREAIEEAKKYYSNVDGCFLCCNPCRTK